MIIFRRLILRCGAIAASASLTLLSSVAFGASPVSAPARPNMGTQIVVPGEPVEQIRKNSRAHSNKLRNKVSIERDNSAAIDSAAEFDSLLSKANSLPKTEFPTYAADVQIGK